MMLVAALAVSVLALLASVSLLVVVCREAAVMRATLGHVLHTVHQARSATDRARGQAEQARAEGLAARLAVQALREVVDDIHSETCGPVALRPCSLPPSTGHPGAS